MFRWGRGGLVESKSGRLRFQTQNVCQTIYQKHKRPFQFSGSWKGLEKEGVAFPIRGDKLKQFSHQLREVCFVSWPLTKSGSVKKYFEKLPYQAVNVCCENTGQLGREAWGDCRRGYGSQPNASPAMTNKVNPKPFHCSNWERG